MNPAAQSPGPRGRFRSNPWNAARCAALALAILPAAAEDRAQGRPRRVAFRETAEIPEEGLRIPLIQGARATGLPAPDIRAGSLLSGKHSGQARIFQTPLSFWQELQFLGRWEDGQGGRMTLAAVRARLPASWPRPHVLPEEFNEAMRPAQPPDSMDDLRKWIETFAGAAVAAPPRRLRAPMQLAQAWLYDFEDAAPARRGLAFTVAANAFGVDPGQWFFLLLEFDGPTDLEALEQDLNRLVLPGIQPMPRTAAPPAALEVSARQRALNSIRGRSGWQHVETPNYLILSDLRAQRAMVIRQIVETIEPVRAAFAVLVPPRAPVREPGIIRIFSQPREFSDFTDGFTGAGRFCLTRLEMVLRPDMDLKGQTYRDWIRQFVYHEAFHQYLFFSLSGRIPGAWINEGYASFFEGADIARDGRVVFDEVPLYASRLDAMVNAGGLPVAELMALSYEAFYGEEPGGSRDQSAKHYALAWGLVYFLHKDAEARPVHPFAGLADRYFDAFDRTGDNARAAAAALDGASPEDLGRALAEFWTSPARRRAARLYDPLAARR